MNSSIRFIIFILTFHLMIKISDTLPLEDDHHQHYYSMTNYYIVMIIPIAFNIFNLLGSLYIFYRTFLRWRYDYDKIIPLSARFPFYIAITDFLVSSIILINFSHPASNKEKILTGEDVTWPSPYCEVIGFLNTSFVLLNMLLVGTISFTTWLRVVKEYYFDWGRYDYKIWTPIVFTSFIIPSISVTDFGDQEYWCDVKYRRSIITILVSIVIILTLTTIVICYIHVLKTIRNIKDDSLSTVQAGPIDSFDSIQHTNVERRTLKKILTYILVFMFQYVPLLVSDIYKLFMIRHIVIYVLSPSAVSIGGINNFFQYIYNEGSLMFPTPSNSNIDLEVINDSE